jgi:hypothetical protein
VWKISKHFKHLEFKDYQSKYNLEINHLKFFLVVILFINFIILGIQHVNEYTDPAFYDTTAYLGGANFIKHHGGVLNFFNLSITGKYLQANQHPLYILFLTPFASTDISFFILAKIISIVFGFILLVFLFFIGKKMYGDLVASVALFGIVLNGVFLQWTSMVACESLLMIFSLLCFYFVYEGFKNNRNWIYAGIFAGLAYLTKGTAILLLPGFVISAFLIYKWSLLRNKFFWLFFILFILAASPPLIIRNIVVFENPFYNVNNHILTMGQEKIDSTRYITFDLKDGTAIWKFEENTITNESNIKKEFPEDKSLIKLDNIGELFKKNIIVLLDTLSISWAGKLPSTIKYIFTFLLLLLFCIGIMREENRGGKFYLIITMGLFFISLLRIPIDRYYLPLIPFIWIYIALGIFTLTDYAVKRFAKQYKFKINLYISIFLIIILLFHAGFQFWDKEINNPLNSVEYNESRDDILNWLRKNLDEDDQYTMGPNFNWQLKKGTWILPPVVAWADFLKFRSFVKRHNVTYIIIDSNTIEDFTNTRNILGEKVEVNGEQSFTEYFEYDPIEGIIEKKKVNDWNIVYKDQKEPVGFIIYNLTN